MSAFLACRTCGRYVTGQDAVNRAFCSDPCTEVYDACRNCGRWFVRGTGFDGEHCTRECTVHYQILRKYGPEPVTVVTEV